MEKSKQSRPLRGDIGKGRNPPRESGYGEMKPTLVRIIIPRQTVGGFLLCKQMSSHAIIKSVNGGMK